MNLIFLLKKKVGLLNIRHRLMYTDYANKSEYERNEIRIQDIDTETEILKTLKNIEQLELNLKNSIDGE
jgi:hypothetical protein